MEAHIREIEEANRIQEHAITKIKWIKPQSVTNKVRRGSIPCLPILSHAM